MTRRGPAPGQPAGFDVIEMGWHLSLQTLRLIMLRFDRKGHVIEKMDDRLLLQLTKHATESLFQRLRTTDANVIAAELRPVGPWLLQHTRDIFDTPETHLLTPNGVLPVKQVMDWRVPGLDSTSYWEATTWIADDGLEDHTPYKRRVAEAVREARRAGCQVGLVKV